MTVTLSPGELETLLVSLDYSWERVSNAQGTPAIVRKENLARLEAVREKLRAARNASLLPK